MLQLFIKKTRTHLAEKIKVLLKTKLYKTLLLKDKKLPAMPQEMYKKEHFTTFEQEFNFSETKKMKKIDM